MTHSPFSPAKQKIIQPKPEGYGDDLTAKYGHSNCIQVNGFHVQGNSAKSFALAMKKTMT